MPILAFAAVVALQGVPSLENAVQRQPNAANYRALADAYVSAEQFDRASVAFYKAGSLYAKLGDLNAAKALKTQGERYETKISLFFERRSTSQSDQQYYTGAK